MNIEKIQNALFYAYDIKYNIGSKDLKKKINQDSGETLGDALEEIIATLEALEIEQEEVLI